MNLSRLPRWLIYLGILCILLLTLTALFYAWTDWSGHQAWQSAKRTLEKQEEPLTFEAFREQKSAAGVQEAPEVLAEWMNEEQAAQWSEQLEFQGRAELDDAEGWAELLPEIDRRVAMIESLGVTRSGPILFPLDFENPVETLIPQSRPLMAMAQVSRAQAEAGIALGRPELAMAGLQRMQQVRSWLSSPLTLIEAMVGLSIERMMNNVINDGLQRDVWGAEQRAVLRSMVEGARPAESIAEGLRGERIFFVIITEDVTTSRLLELGLLQSSASSHFLGLLPRGWLEADRARYALALQDAIEALMQGQKPQNQLAGLAWQHPLTRQAASRLDGLIELAIETEVQRKQLVEALNLP